MPDVLFAKAARFVHHDANIRYVKDTTTLSHQHVDVVVFEAAHSPLPHGRKAAHGVGIRSR